MDQTSVEPAQIEHEAPVDIVPSADITDTKMEISNEPIGESLTPSLPTPTPTLASGRSQRVRKLPKRWEDANIETPTYFSRKSAKNTPNSNNNNTNNNNNNNHTSDSPKPSSTPNQKTNKVDKSTKVDDTPSLDTTSATPTESNSDNTVMPTKVEIVDEPKVESDDTAPLATKVVTPITKPNMLKVIKGINLEAVTKNSKVLKNVKVKIIPKKAEQDNNSVAMVVKAELKSENDPKVEVVEPVKEDNKAPQVVEGNNDLKVDAKEDNIETSSVEPKASKVEKVVVKEESKDDEESDDSEDDEEEGIAEDDPEFDPEGESEKLWCLCRQRYDDRFMIACDCCGEWYHGKCVGVTQQQGRKFERLKQEWFCSPCDAGIKNGTDRAILKQQNIDKFRQIEAREKAAAKAKKVAKVEAKSKPISKPAKTAKSSPAVATKRKSVESDRQPSPTKSSSIKSSPMKDSSMARKKVPKTDLEKEKEKVMEKELKKSALAAKAQLKERMLKMQISVSSNEGDSKPKSEADVSKIPSTRPSLISPPLPSPTKKKSHYKEFHDDSKNELFKVDPVLNRSLSTSAVSEAHTTLLERRNSSTSSVTAKVERRKSVGPATPVAQAGGKRERTESISSGHHDKSEVKPAGEHKRNSVSSVSSLAPPPTSKVVHKKDEKRDYFYSRILEIFVSRYKKRTNKELSPIQENAIKAKTKEIEHEFYRLYRSDNKKYCNKLRSLVSNLMDQKNELYRKVILDKIPVAKLATMSVEELAGSELAKWREQEKKKDIEMIKRDQEEQASLVSSMTKKTHKGDVMVNEEDETVLDTGNGNDPVDSAAVTVDEDGQQHLTPISHFEGANADAHNATSLETSPSPFSPPDVSDDSKKDDVADEPTYNVEEMLGIGPGRIRTQSSSSSVSGSISENVSLEEASVSSATSNSVNATPTPAPEPKKLAPIAEISTSALDKEMAKILNSHQQHHHHQPGASALLDDPSTASQPSVYNGEVHMPDVGIFHVKATNIGGKIAMALQTSVTASMAIQGRADPAEIWDYVSKLMHGKKTEFGLIRLLPDNGQDSTYNEVFEYLHQRSRYGVVKNHGKFYRDIYLIPLGESEDVPEQLTSIPGFRIPPKNLRPNMLLILMIKLKSSGSIDQHLATHSHEQHVSQHLAHHESHSSHHPGENTHSEDKAKKDTIEDDDEPYIPEPIPAKRLKTSPGNPHEPMDTANNNVANNKADKVYEPPVTDPRIKGSLAMSLTQQDTIIMTAITETTTTVLGNDNATEPKTKGIQFDMDKLKNIQIPSNLKDLFRPKANATAATTTNSNNNHSVNSAAPHANEGYHLSQTVSHNGSPLTNFSNDHNYQPQHPQPPPQHAPFGPHAPHHEMHPEAQSQHGTHQQQHPPYEPQAPHHEQGHHGAHHGPPGSYPPPGQAHHYGREEMPPHHPGHHPGHHGPPPHHQPGHHHEYPHGFEHHSGHHRGHTPPPPPHHHQHGQYEHHPHGEHGDHAMHPQYPPNHHPHHHPHHAEGHHPDPYYDDYPQRGRPHGGPHGQFRGHGGGRFNNKRGAQWENQRY